MDFYAAAHALRLTRLETTVFIDLVEGVISPPVKLSDLETTYSISKSYAHKLVTNLTKKGVLNRARHGVYVLLEKWTKQFNSTKESITIEDTKERNLSPGDQKIKSKFPELEKMILDISNEEIKPSQFLNRKDYVVWRRENSPNSEFKDSSVITSGYESKFTKKGIPCEQKSASESRKSLKLQDSPFNYIELSNRSSSNKEKVGQTDSSEWGDIKKKDYLSKDTYVCTLNCVQIEVCKEDVLSFAEAITDKLQSYLNNPFIQPFRTGVDETKRSFSLLLRGAALCKFNSYPPIRFIEAQYYFYDQWKKSAPPLHYIVSFKSEWNSIERYKRYCDKFDSQLNYFEDGTDNIESTVSVDSTPPPAYSINSKEQAIEMTRADINRLMDKHCLSEKQVLKRAVRPHQLGIARKEYLEQSAAFIELCQEVAWGPITRTDPFFNQFIENNVTR